MQGILVIDDQDLITDFLEQALTRLGYTVTTASRASEGLRFYEKGNFDVIITDMIMPDADGTAIVKHVRNSDRPNTPIIGMSGTPWLLAHNGFDHILAKPFSLKDLLAVLDRLLACRAAPGRRQTPEQSRQQTSNARPCSR